MATYTVSVLGACSGGLHLGVRINKDGVPIRDTYFDKDDLFDANPFSEEMLLTLMRQAIKNSGATTLAQAKAAVEAASWSM